MKKRINNSIQFLLICVLTQQPKCHLQSEHERKKENKHIQSTKQNNLHHLSNDDDDDDKVVIITTIKVIF
jgi:hypothetical protein